MTEAATEAAPAVTRGPQRAHVTGAVLLAAVLFGLCNISWRYGEGSVAAIAATRAAIGLLLFAPIAVRMARSGALLRITRDPAAIASCVIAGSTMWIGALLFRSVPGPVAAATLGLLPVVTLLVGRLAGSRSTPAKAVMAMLIATAAALVAAGPVTPSWALLTPVGLFLGAECASLLFIESARRRHDASTLVIGGMIVGSLPAPFLLAAAGAGLDGPTLALSGAVAAAAVALFGTAARVLIAHAQGSVSAAVAGSSTQVTALVTAFAGVLLFADALSPARAVALVLGAAAATLAVWWSAPTRSPAALSAADEPRPAQE